MANDVSMSVYGKSPIDYDFQLTYEYIEDICKFWCIINIYFTE